ncbi:MAG: hypothetical protein NT070_23665 [Cyanobacteria bacterium]|nr:hypothetical protein [Cyanobacteriota bacterium]
MSFDALSISSDLLGDWTCPGSNQSNIFIEPGEAADEIIARDPMGTYWSEGVAKVSDDGAISISFNTGVSVNGTPSEDLNRIDWSNGTVWYREGYEEY